jgi:multidrug efflux pump subunit AcrA (membrane-fusion protein)
MQRQGQREARHTALLDAVVRGSLVASGGYEEKIVFRDYFSSSEVPEGTAVNDADTDLDYSDVQFGVPAEDELEILQRMLADNTVTVSGLTGPPDPPETSTMLSAPREIARADIEQDREWL